jgi:branched-chain amino acid transport system substrate-binding protein
MRVRPQLSTRAKVATLIGLGVITLTACGTRLPNSDFSLSQNGQQIPGATNSTAPGASNAPGSGTTQGNNPTGTGTGNGGTGGSAGTQGHSVVQGGTQGTAGKVSGSASAADFSSLCTAAPAGQKNTASDIGVTPTQITIGNITSDDNPFGSDQFSPNHWGAYAFAQYCNSRGGINGRMINFQHCNDGGRSSGNVTCVNGLVAKNVFAFIGNNSFQYGGAQTVNSKDRPDIGGEPIQGAPYYTYPHLYNIYGDGYPKDGKHAGYQNQYWGLPNVGQWFKAHEHITRVGVVYYSEADSQRGAAQFQKSLQAVGIEVKLYAIAISGTPDSAVTAMQHDKQQAVFDALDDTGNIKLCDSMQNHNYRPVAKVSTISTWTGKVGKEFNSLCQSIMFSTGSTANYADSPNPVANEFRQAFARYAGGQTPAQWALEGWVSGIWLAQAVKSCGAAPTRPCVEKWINDQKSLSAYGLMDPQVNFQKIHYTTSTKGSQCTSVVHWEGGSSGSWKTLADPSKSANCYSANFFHYNTE